MNIFSHFYFASKPLDSPFYTVGLIYPTLNRKRRNETFPNEEFQEGIEEHKNVDRIFHSQDWFHKAQFRLASEHEDFPFRRKAVLYHVGLEIAIDNYLMNEKEQSHFIRRTEDKLEDSEVKEFLNEHDLHAAGILRLLVKNRRIRSYGSIPGCVFGLKRTYEKIVGLYPQLRVPIKGELLEIIYRSQKEVKPRIDEIKDLMGN